MLLAFLVQQTESSEGIMREALRMIESAQTISVTKVSTSEEFPREVRTRYWFRKGGFFRVQASKITDVGSPDGGWTYRSDKKIFQKRPPVPTRISPASFLELDILRGQLPPIGLPRRIVWHGRKTIRVELDGRKQMTKETKLFVFFDPKTHLPIGISANLGSLTQVRIFDDFKLNPKIDTHRFRFTPPRSWKQVTASTGGWG